MWLHLNKVDESKFPTADHHTDITNHFLPSHAENVTISVCFPKNSIIARDANVGHFILGGTEWGKQLVLTGLTLN